MVDDADFDWLSQYKWHAHWDGKSWRAVCSKWENGKTKKILMHRLVMQPKEGELVDHRNHNSLDNQRHNLRNCSCQENNRNHKLRLKNKTSQYKGVCWFKPARLWVAQITVNYKRICIGYFKDEIEAARAYDEAALKYHGTYAFVNFSDPGAQITIKEL
jgi:hypothetical protein